MSDGALAGNRQGHPAPARNVANSGLDARVVGRGGNRPGSAPSRQTGPAERWRLWSEMRQVPFFPTQSTFPSMAHKGGLFLDEMREFDRKTLEVLRQPLEEGKVTTSQAMNSLTLPADFILVAAMNPCPCGYLQISSVAA